MYLVLHFQRIQSVKHEVKSVPPFTFFGTMRLTGNFEKKIQKKFFSQFLVSWELLLFFLKRVPNSPILWHFEVLLLFLSLRYGADLGRSRLVCLCFGKFFNVSEGSLLHFFDILQQTGFSKSPKSPPSTILKTLRFLSLGYGANFRRPRLVSYCFQLYLDNADWEMQFLQRSP